MHFTKINTNYYIRTRIVYEYQSKSFKFLTNYHYLQILENYALLHRDDSAQSSAKL